MSESDKNLEIIINGKFITKEEHEHFVKVMDYDFPDGPVSNETVEYWNKCGGDGIRQFYTPNEIENLRKKNDEIEYP